MDKLKVFHGSYCEVRQPSLEYGREDADFGTGFYVTTDVEMAEKWASRRKNAIISEYYLSLQELNGLEFELNKSWLDFVIQNRSGNERMQIDLTEVDYIQGATADDKLFAVIEQYESNLLDADTAILAMNAMKIGEQIALISEEGIRKLEFVSSYQLSENRKEELKRINLQLRKETNDIVENILKEKVRMENEKPGPAPVFKRRQGR